VKKGIMSQSDKGGRDDEKSEKDAGDFQGDDGHG
jgi:hypothetical protein